MTATTVRPIAVKLNQDIRDRIKRLAETRHRTPHWMMREAIQQYVEREEKREVFRQDGIRAWSDYQATGLHVTLDEADSWLAKLEEGQDVEPPECHV
jgi:predicted transcriptional regulator